MYIVGLSTCGFAEKLKKKKSTLKVSVQNRSENIVDAQLRSAGGGNGNPLQYSCLKHSMDRGTWWATVHGVVKS